MYVIGVFSLKSGGGGVPSMILVFSHSSPTSHRLFPKYAYIGQTAYQHSVIDVAVKGVLSLNLFNVRTGHKNDRGIA